MLKLKSPNVLCESGSNRQVLFNPDLHYNALKHLKKSGKVTIFTAAGEVCAKVNGFMHLTVKTSQLTDFT